MPRYDYRCAEGHVAEVNASRDTSALACPECGAAAARVTLTAPSINGFVRKPTREHYVNLNRFVEAQGELVEDARRMGIAPPDLYGEAQRRVAAGEVAAIE